MSASQWFDDLPVVGAMPPGEAAAILREVGEEEVAEALEEAPEEASHAFGPGTGKHWWSFPDKLWLHTAHAFGYLAPTTPGSNLLPIHPLDVIQADTTLKQARVKITLVRLRVASYP